jgi:GT2 family glycosyltransferase
VSARIAVVVPTFQRRALVTRAVAALAAQRPAGAAAQIEVVVVCDGCTDGTAHALRAATPQNLAVRVIEQANAGQAAARNAGAAATTAPGLLFLDDDMIAAPDLVAVHLEAAAANPAAARSGSIAVDPGSPRSFVTEGLRRWGERRDARLAAAPGLPWDEALTGHLYVPRRAFDAAGGFETSFTANGGFGGEDLEFGWRLARAGVPLAFEPRAITYQVYAKTFRELARDIRRSAAGDLRLVARHPEAATRLMLGSPDTLPPWERRALAFSRRHPGLARALFAPLLSVLDTAARTGRCGKRWEHAHAVARAHLYGLGLADAGAPTR